MKYALEIRFDGNGEQIAATDNLGLWGLLVALVEAHELSGVEFANHKTQGKYDCSVDLGSDKIDYMVTGSSDPTAVKVAVDTHGNEVSDGFHDAVRPLLKALVTLAVGNGLNRCEFKRIVQ